MRALFEAMSPPVLAELRAEAFAELSGLLTPQGIPLHQKATFALAQHPGPA